MSRDRDKYAGTHLGAGFYFPSYQYVKAEITLPNFELYTYFASLNTEKHSYMFFLESLTADENARYSILGYYPRLIIETNAGLVNISDNSISHNVESDIFSTLRAILGAQNPGDIAKADYFYGGMVGFWGYDLALEAMGIKRVNCPASNLPDGAFFLPGIVVVQDRYTSIIRVYGFYQQEGKAEQDVRCQVNDTIQAILNAASRSINQPPLLTSTTIVQDHAAVEQIVTASPRQDTAPKATIRDKEAEFLSNTTRPEFLAMVSKVQEHIHRGDIFQAVISQRWEKTTQADPGEVYARLRSLNPSPYMFYLHFPDFTMVGSSPEMLVKVEKDKLQTRPIAGTRPVTQDKVRNAALRQELTEDAKEKSEHLMLVDLGRNDVGKVSQPGTVAVKQFMKVEAYSHVMHLVSVIEGQLKTGEDGLSALQACFPAGTLSGAPKRRAMEIIEQLEKSRRGPYGGAVGYLGWNGCLDSCITIRSILFRKGHCYLQAGAGIVADSSPESEYQETVNKAQALMNAIVDVEESI